MSEISFCKQFLTALNSRPIKLSSDHIADARNYPAQSPFILPKLPSPPHPARPVHKAPSTTSPSASSSTSTPSITVTLKPTKPGPPTSSLPSIIPSKTSIYDLKTAYSTTSSYPLTKIKILYKKKPAADSKTVAELIGTDAGNEVEFQVMVMGGAAPGAVASPPAATPPSEAEKGLGGGSVNTPPAAVGPSGKEVVVTAEFWDDLKGFVTQRIKDEKEGERLAGLFRGAWEKDR